MRKQSVHRVWFVLGVVALAAVVWQPSARAAGAKPFSYMSDLVAGPDSKVDKVGGITRIRSTNGKMAKATTRTRIYSGFTATIVAQTDSKNLRLFYGDKGIVIFNWEVRPAELCYLDLRTGERSGVADAGAIPVKTWVTIVWTIMGDHCTITVNGEARAVFRGNYSGLQADIGVGTYGDATVLLKELALEPPIEVGGNRTDKSKPVAKAGAAPTDDGKLIEVEIPAGRRAAKDAATEAADRAAPEDPNVIERPEFREKPRPLIKSITSVTAMTVVVGADGQANGVTSDIIATVPPASRKGQKAGAGFSRADGDATMRAAFEEAVRAVNLRYPMWEPGHIDFSFGEKFVAHGGPSAGTAFGLLLLSVLEGFDIDPACAVTGDITVDWKVRKVGGVTAKLRGAALEKRACALIPEGNETAVPDMAVLYGDSALWDIQVFSIANLQQAVAVARKDRAPALADAMKRFDALKAQVATGGRDALIKPTTRAALKEIISRAPNHLSARYLLAISEGKLTRNLSANATLYQVSVIFYPYRGLLDGKQKVDRTALPVYVTAAARKRLIALRPIAHRDLQSLVGDLAAYVDAMDAFAANGGTGPNQRVVNCSHTLEADFAAIDSNPRFFENLIHEAY